MDKELTAFDWALCIGKKILDIESGRTQILEPEDYGLMAVFLKHNVKDTYKNFKPILRSLDQITEEEKEELCDGLDVVLENHRYRIVDKIHDPWGESWEYYTLEVYDWLTQKGFDIRGWIDAGLAVKYNEVEHGQK